MPPLVGPFDKSEMKPTTIAMFVLVVTTTLAVLLLGASCGEAENPAPTVVPTATVEPDVVVGVRRLCELAPSWDPNKEAMGPPSSARVRWYQQLGCAGIPEHWKLNDRIEVTVRTGTGGSYVVTVPPGKVVRVGDVWGR